MDFRNTLIAIALCLLIIVGWNFIGNKYFPPTPPAATQSPQPAPAAPGPPPAEAPRGTGTPPALTAPQGQWHLAPAAATPDLTLGSRDKQSKYFAQVDFDGASAAIRQVLLSEHKFKVTDKETGYPLLVPGKNNQNQPVYSLTLGRLRLVGQNEIFDLSRAVWTLENSTPEALTWAATIQDAQNLPMLRVRKTYTFKPETHDLGFQVSVANLAGQPIAIDSLELIGPVGPLREDPRTDYRSVVAAYTGTDNKMQVHRKTVPELEKAREKNEPSLISPPAGANLSWFAVNNKFFTAIMRSVPSAGAPATYLTGPIQPEIVHTALDTKEVIAPETLYPQAVIKTDAIAPGSERLINFSLYLGPIDKDIFDQQYAQFHYELIQPASSCSWCAFDWLTFALIKLLKWMYLGLHNYGVAIIILVLVVRLILHPITKHGQVSMMKMQKLGPKMEEIKKKYAGNKEEIQKRTFELQKQMGMTPIMGCLPMLLQMPIWIALYTAVNVNVAIRHQGLFPASWHWLTDLSAPDRLIPFSVFGIHHPVMIPLLGNLIGGIDAFNLLPILLAIGMYLQTKLTPQPTTMTNPQAAQQQKMMLIMMPVMMLLFLYPAPSGLNLYIMASTFGGIIEQYIIRKHIREKEAVEAEITVEAGKLAGKGAKKKPKPPKRYF